MLPVKNLARDSERGQDEAQSDVAQAIFTNCGKAVHKCIKAQSTRATVLGALKLGTDGLKDRIANLQRRTGIVHDHFKELFTDPLHWETPEWV